MKFFEQTYNSSIFKHTKIHMLDTMASYIESFEGFRLVPYGCYLVILPLVITKALMQYHIKPLGITKTQGFH